MITLLTRQDMAKVFTMAEAVQAAKDALALYSAGDTDIPPPRKPAGAGA